MPISQPRRRRRPGPSCSSPLDDEEDLASLPPSLSPEIDDEGNLEYKLKLARPTSLHRLERLRTQCKWRLVQGGGCAVYELGVLDHGELVGLDRDAMRESLDTLQLMLAGLGGGTIEVTRVIRLVNRADDDDDEHCRDADGDDVESPFDAFVSVAGDLDRDGDLCRFPPSSPSPSRRKGPTPFPSNRPRADLTESKRSKRVAARRATARENGDKDINRDETATVTLRTPAAAATAATDALELAGCAEKGTTRDPVPTTIVDDDDDDDKEVERTSGWRRTPLKPPKPPRPPRRRKLVAREERDEARRLKRERERDLATYPPSEGDGNDDAEEDEVKLEIRTNGASSGGRGGKPRVYIRRGEVRWVVEAVVEKKTLSSSSSSSNASRRHPTRTTRLPHSGREEGEGSEVSALRQNDDQDEDPRFDIDAAAVGRGIPSGGGKVERRNGRDSQRGGGGGGGQTAFDQEEEGWSFLTFDLNDLSASVKAAAASLPAA